MVKEFIEQITVWETDRVIQYYVCILIRNIEDYTVWLRFQIQSVVIKTLIDTISKLVGFKFYFYGI